MKTKITVFTLIVLLFAGLITFSVRLDTGHSRALTAVKITGPNDNPVAEVIPNAVSLSLKRELQTLHHVEPGDNLYRISRKYVVSVAALKPANDDKDNFSAVGEWLVIPKLPKKSTPKKPVSQRTE